MLLNEDLVLRGECAVLVPYCAEHVPVYHRWMSSPQLLRLTASEQLTLAEEYTSMAEWRADANKLTFIVVDASTGRMAGDVNVVLKVDAERPGLAEIDVMVADSGARRKGIAQEAVAIAMAYAVTELCVDDSFVAKIVHDNEPSLKLFTSKLGYVEVKRVPAFQEVHLERQIDDKVRKELDAVQRQWSRESYAAMLFKRGGVPWT
jgi:RimJ/RimL family protein N-acetyltransferase